MRALLLLIVLTAAAANGAEPPQAPPPDLETVRRGPTARVVPMPQRFRFEPQGDATTEELDRLAPYLKGKPLYEEDRKALGPAMRHLKELN